MMAEETQPISEAPERESNYEYFGGVSQYCKTCGAVVYMAGLHARWHESLIVAAEPENGK